MQISQSERNRMASILKDYVHCPVCYELMQGHQHEPYALQCLHTLCQSCMSTMSQGGTSDASIPSIYIKCPQCKSISERFAVKKDFRTKSLVEDYLKDKNKLRNDFSTTQGKDGNAKCGMCEDASRLLKSKCIDCQLYLCGECEHGHKKIPALKMHTLQSVAIALKNIESGMKKTILELEKMKGNTVQCKSVIANECGKIDKITEEAVKKVNKVRTKLHKEVDSHHDNLIKKIQEERTKMKQKLTAENQNVDVVVKDIQGKLTQLNDLMKKKDKNKMIMSGDVVNKHVLEGIHNIHERIQSILGQKSQFQIHVNNPKPMDENNSTNINVECGMLDNSTGNQNKSDGNAEEGSINNVHLSETVPNSEPGMSAKLNYTMLTKVESLTGNGRRLHVYANELWCTTWNALHIYNKINGDLIKSIYWEINEWASAVIPANEITATSAATENSKLLLVAYYHVGLQLVSDDGKQLDVLCEGEFSDVTSYSDQVYALEWKEQRIYVFEYHNIDRTLVQIGFIQLRYENGHSCDKLCISDHSIYISSWNNSCFHVFDFEGVLLETHGVANDSNGNQSTPTSGMLESPKLCCLDAEGSALIADSKNCRLQWCSESGIWEIISIPGQLGEPEDAIIDTDDESVWVLTYKSGYKLLKFK